MDEKERLQALWAEQDRKFEETLSWIKILGKVMTPEGVVGTVVELVVPFNALYFEKSRMKAKVWFGIENDQINVSWNEYSLYELTPPPLNI